MSVESKPGVISSVLNWLRKGYPDGVPTTDYFPLLALLRRRLTSAELDEIVSDLTSSGHLPADRSVVLATIERIAQQEPTEEDVSLVAARLAAAGWPLAGRPEPTEPSSPEHPTVGAAAQSTFLKSVVGWLREGYPQGVPPQDYIPLLALLRRRLTDEETIKVAQEIIAAGDRPATPSDIGVLITKVTNELPSEDDITRVREHLEERGWPVRPVAGS
ncbi:Protein of unknown function [Nakamurella panacisegetis]|uniref:DUF3349 domain-containing protein n=1 Tax=Nakamurella panacisegetis TaxID=1090615 RepID=A0A1H0HEX8_9ACTN|nr:DUF3349 domain-containing protein [Nakamurella panacisegetis]SDO17633.1 Protein of unknown function [Nakamurella panacisegetis]